MRKILAIGVFATTLLGPLGEGRAYYEGPWCAVTNRGGGEASWNCSMRSLEMCRQEVIAGNRGWCNPNPRWLAREPDVRRSRHRRRSEY